MFFLMQYKRVMWGLILALIDIRIGSIDILPDFAGYILITMGLSELAEQHHLYGKAKKFTQWLILLSLPDTYKAWGNTSQLFGNYTMVILTFILAVIIVIKMFMAGYICSAIMELSQDKKLTEFYEKADFGRKAYLFINGTMVFIIFLGIGVGEGYRAAVLFIPVIPVLIAEILLIHLVYKGGKQLTSEVD